MKLWRLDVDVPAETAEQAVLELLGILAEDPQALQEEGWLDCIEIDDGYLTNTEEQDDETR